MDFKQAKENFKKLAENYRNGRISGEDYADAVDDLAVKDDKGREWKIGLQSGAWYRKEEDSWVEDTPPEPPTKQPKKRQKESPAQKRVRRIILLLMAVVFAVAFCLLNLFYGGGGAQFFSDLFGGMGNAGGEQGDSQPGEPGGDTAAQPSNSGEEGQGGEEANLNPTETKSLPGGGQQSDQNGGDGATATAQGPQPTPQPSLTPTVTPTSTPPPPEVPPQVWRTLTNTLLNDINSFSGEWGEVPDREWEYEVLTYQSRQALFLQFTEAEELFYSGDQTVVDMERSIDLALPDEDARVDIVCRWQNGRGYALALTNQRWTLMEIENGVEHVLANGEQSNAFQQGEYATFRLRCVGQQLSAWRGQKILASVEDSTFNAGTTGLRFDPQGGVALAYISADRLRTHVAGQDTAGLADSVRLGLLEVTVPRGLQEYPLMEDTGYAGQPMVSLQIRLSNLEGDQAVMFSGQNFYLTNGEQRVYALEFIPQNAGDTNALLLPQTLYGGSMVTGEVFFAGISLDELDGSWELVVDLRYQALGEARFALK